MKKTLLLLALAAGLAGTAQGQARRQDLAFGLRGGATYAGITGRGTRSTDFKFGYHAGLMVDYAIVNNYDNVLSVHPEVLYSLKGYQSRDLTVPQPDVDLSYVDVPLLLRYKANGLYVEAGPQAGFLLSASSQDADIKQFFRTVSIDYAGGFGLEATNGVSIGVRFNGSVNDVFKPIEVPGATAVERIGKNAAFMVSLGYLFLH